MDKYNDLQNERIEKKLSHLGALLSLATEEVIDAEQKPGDVKSRLEEIQQEIEQAYITLDEPFLYDTD